MHTQRSLRALALFGVTLALVGCGTASQPATTSASTPLSPATDAPTVATPNTPGPTVTTPSTPGPTVATPDTPGPNDTGWLQLSAARPELANALADPQAALDNGLTCTYGFMGIASAYLDLDADQTRSVLEALARTEQGPESSTRWNDYGDDLLFSWPDGTRCRLSFEGREALVDANDGRHAYVLRNADQLWSLLGAFQAQATKDW